MFSNQKLKLFSL